VSGIALEVAVILLLLLVNGVFSMSEMAVMAAKKTRLEHRAEEGDLGARAALDLAANPTSFLSTVQVGITLVGVLAGAFGGAGISKVIAAALRDAPWVGRYAEPVAFGLVVSAITYLSLIVGELVPKQIALGNPERIAAAVARPMRVVARVGSPLVSVLTGSTRFVFRLLGMRANADAGVTEQDVRAMVEQGAEAGAVHPAEHEIVENTFRLGDRRASTIMTPRLDVAWLDASASPDETRRRLAEAGRSPFLVCDGDVERVLGVAHAEDLLARALAGEPADPRAVLREALFVPATMPVLGLLASFRATGHHAAVALDEFGGVAGLVTLDDILEALVGELPERGAPAAAEIARQPDGSWLVGGGAAITDVDAVVDLDAPADAGRRGLDTVGGLVMSLLGRLPAAGDHVDYGAARLTVEHMDGRRVALVRVRLLPSDRS
jgi:putative hemolysin